MRCDRCGKGGAVPALTVIVGSLRQEVHLCEDCYSLYCEQAGKSDVFRLQVRYGHLFECQRFDRAMRARSIGAGN